MLPFEFLIDGPPVSLQTHNRKRLEAWRNRVKREAAQKWPVNVAPIFDEVSVDITYFYEIEAGDVDNIIKPIQDGLIGVVYIDDSQVTKTSCTKSEIGGSFRVKGVSPELAVRLALGREFLRIRVLQAPMHEDLS